MLRPEHPPQRYPNVFLLVDDQLTVDSPGFRVDHTRSIDNDSPVQSRLFKYRLNITGRYLMGEKINIYPRPKIRAELCIHPGHANRQPNHDKQAAEPVRDFSNPRATSADDKTNDEHATSEPDEEDEKRDDIQG